MDRDLLEAYYEVELLDPSQTVHVTTARWDIVAPWEATYWKTLPQAHRLRYRYSNIEEWQPAPSEFREAQHRLRDRTRWYMHPFRSASTAST